MKRERIFLFFLILFTSILGFYNENKNLKLEKQIEEKNLLISKKEQEILLLQLNSVIYVDLLEKNKELISNLENIIVNSDIKIKELENELEIRQEKKDKEILLLAKLLYCEARGMSDKGQIYVCSAILNMMDYTGRSLEDLAHDRSVYSVANIVDSVQPLPKQFEIIDRVRSGERIKDIVYFRTKHYHGFGTPVCEVDGVYFSKP